MSMADLVGAVFGLVFTLLVFSYILGDNPLFRITIHIFIGVAAEYAGIMAINNVILPRLIMPLISGTRDERLLALVPLILAWLLLTKISPRLASFGNVSMAFLVGVGAAAAIGGAVTGTLFPQIFASINLYDLDTAGAFDVGLGLRLVNGTIILLGTAATLAYFHFGIMARPNRGPRLQEWIKAIGQGGQVFIAMTLGFLFAGVFSAALLALIERLNFLVNFVKTYLAPFIS